MFGFHIFTSTSHKIDLSPSVLKEGPSSGLLVTSSTLPSSSFGVWGWRYVGGVGKPYLPWGFMSSILFWFQLVQSASDDPVDGDLLIGNVHDFWGALFCFFLAHLFFKSSSERGKCVFLHPWFCALQLGHSLTFCRGDLCFIIHNHKSYLDSLSVTGKFPQMCQEKILIFCLENIYHIK